MSSDLSCPIRGFDILHRFNAAGANSITWASSGAILAIGSEKAVGFWDIDSGKCTKTFTAHNSVDDISWSPAGKLLAVVEGRTISLWDVRTGIHRHVLQQNARVAAVSWSPSGRALAVMECDGSLSVWQLPSARRCWTVNGPGGLENGVGVAWRPDGSVVATGSRRSSAIRLWNAADGEILATLKAPYGWGSALCVSWSPDGKHLAAGTGDSTIFVWDAPRQKHVAILEGPTDTVTSVAFSSDSKVVAAASLDGKVRCWRCDTMDLFAVMEVALASAPKIAFSPVAPLLASCSPDPRDGFTGFVWRLDLNYLLDGAPHHSTVRYTNAKVVLVGDQGVGKSGLSLVLTGKAFSPTESTHGRQVLVLDSKQFQSSDNRVEIRETLLWDLAGQPGYRLIHQLHLSEVVVALVVFDARNENDVFAGIRHWDRALRQAHSLQGTQALPLKKFLVAARTDRGGKPVSAERLSKFLADTQFDGYFETSARDGLMIGALSEAVHNAIDWECLPRVSSSELFQEIKTFLLEETNDQRRLLSTTEDLYRTFLRSSSGHRVSNELRRQFDVCIALLEARGLIRRLSFGNMILLKPELLDAYASALVNSAKDEPEGLGCIAEDKARDGQFQISPDARIKDHAQEKLLLIAMVEDLLRYEIVLREQSDSGVYLVFPSQLTREFPNFADLEGKSVVFTFEGPVLNVYATLAVRLSHTGMFRKKEMWKNAATYSALIGGTCSMILREIQEGRGELTLIFDKQASQDTRFHFEAYVAAHLERRALPESIERRRVLECPDCATPLTDLMIRRRMALGHQTIRCSVCDRLISLADAVLPPNVSSQAAVPEMDRLADATRDLSTGLVSASGEMGTNRFASWAGSTRTTLALVFTDIVGYTAMGNSLGNEAMVQILRQHFQQGSKLIKKHGGYEIRTIGDSFMAAFRTASQALNFVTDFADDPGSDKLKIRSGIHVGSCQIEQEDAFGAMVNFTARLQQLAEADEVCVSNRVKEDLDEEKATNHVEYLWREVVGVELKGFAGKHRLWRHSRSEQKSHALFNPSL